MTVATKPLFLGEPGPLADRKCDWCGRPAVVAYEIIKPRKAIGTGQFLYACSRHKNLAKESSGAQKPAAG